ncbi:uncharacterized protein LOC110677126 [Aedes aegypti]|uniref:Uncharacterized protein n=1 Tax=Aedes aegypti TaxID=7159 RepID=A0A6I8U4X6_AEDAE|nr:uncharacterized protein LOC110677126 [Aedes aegypti]
MDIKDDSDGKLVELIITNPEDIELTDDAGSDAGDNYELLQLITETWCLDRVVYDILIAHGYTLEYAKTLDEKALNDVFSITKWTAHKHALRQKLTLWKESVLFREGDTEPVASCSYQVPVHNMATSSAAVSPQRKLIPTSVSRALLDNILERNEKEKIVAKYYQLHSRLDKQHRKFLSHTIVDYYIANQKYFALPDMSRFAELIAERFPSEIAVTYYNPRSNSANKKHPSGMLYDRFYNRKKTSASTISSVPLIEPTIHSEQAALKISETEIRHMESNKVWLRNNCAPGEQVLSRWKQSVQLRLRSIQHDKDKNKPTVLSEWPRYLDEDGYLLVDVDFDFLRFPEGK